MNFTIAQQIKKLSSICVLLLGLHATSQENIKGKVVDASNGQPLVGAQIVLNPSQKGTLTDEFGYFQIDAGSDDNSLIVRYLGYEEQEVSISNTNDLGTLALKRSNTTLSEVIVSASPKSFKSEFKGSNFR